MAVGANRASGIAVYALPRRRPLMLMCKAMKAAVGCVLQLKGLRTTIGTSTRSRPRTIKCLFRSMETSFIEKIKNLVRLG